MTDIDCLSINPRTTLFDRPNISVVVGATAGKWQRDDEDQGSLLTCLLLKVLRLTRVWNAGLGQSYAEKWRTPSSRYARYV